MDDNLADTWEELCQLMLDNQEFILYHHMTEDLTPIKIKDGVLYMEANTFFGFNNRKTFAPYMNEVFKKLKTGLKVEIK